MNKQFNIIIVDDDRASTHCLWMKLSKMKQVAAVERTESAAELLERFLPAKNYDIIYLDQLMPGMDGTDAVKSIRQKFPLTKIIFHTATGNLTEAERILKSKPDGWLWKDFKCSDAELSVSTVMEGRHFYSREAEEMLHQLLASDNGNGDMDDSGKLLTPRETEVLVEMCKLRKSHEIAAKLFIDERTVETHRNSIHKKTGLKKTEDLIDYAMRHKFIPTF
jgi:DNA-binding NarL/FixJ family response regulator